MASRQDIYRENIAKGGGKRISVQLLPRDPVDQWAALATRHGGDKPALLYLLGLARGAGAVSDEVLLATLAARLRASPRPPETQEGHVANVKRRARVKTGA